MCHLVSFVIIFDVDKGIVDTAFLDFCNLLKHSLDASPDVDAIVLCLTKKLHKLAIKTRNLKTFVSDEASVMKCAKRGITAKLRKDFVSSMINMHCKCHQACCGMRRYRR